MRRLVALLLLGGCMKHVQVPAPTTAYRITRANDKAVLVVQYKGTRTLEELRNEFCGDQTCMVEVVRLRHDAQ